MLHSFVLLDLEVCPCIYWRLVLVFMCPSIYWAFAGRYWSFIVPLYLLALDLLVFIVPLYLLALDVRWAALEIATKHWQALRQSQGKRKRGHVHSIGMVCPRCALSSSTPLFLGSAVSKAKPTHKNIFCSKVFRSKILGS